MLHHYLLPINNQVYFKIKSLDAVSLCLGGSLKVRLLVSLGACKDVGSRPASVM